uniref:Uncharacterized protein n=1 Tax=Glossina austeni TaxID=7395 RepID=A0A1A9USJ7_GLOAU
MPKLKVAKITGGGPLSHNEARVRRTPPNNSTQQTAAKALVCFFRNTSSRKPWTLSKLELCSTVMGVKLHDRGGLDSEVVLQQQWYPCFSMTRNKMPQRQINRILI